MRTIAALTLAACGGESFDLEIQVPERYRDDVTELRLLVLAPPIAAPFGCEDLAFGRVDPSVIPVSTERELIVRTVGPTTLGELDRATPRVFLAEGLSDGARNLIGCAEASALEDVEVTLPLEPILEVEAIEVSMLSGVVGELPAPALRLRVSDLAGDPQRSVPATWIVAGSGPSTSGEAQSDDMGEVVVSAAERTKPGPYVLDIRVRWATENPMRASGFARSVATTHVIAGASFVDAAVGRFSETFEVALLAMRSDGSPALTFCGSDPFVCTEGAAVPESGRLLAERRAPPMTDGLLLLSPGGWFTVARGEAPIRVAVGAGAEADVAVAAGDCEASDLILLHFGGLDHRLYTADGILLPDRPLFDLDAAIIGSGCANTSEGRRARTYVLRNELEESFLVTYQDGEPHFASWSAVGDGVGVGIRGDGPLLGTQLDLNEYVIARFNLDVYEDGLDLDPIDADYPPGFPVAVGGGDFDADAELDVAAVLTDYDPELDRNRFLLYVALDDVSSGERVSGAVAIDDLDLCDEDAPILMIADTSGDGRDDIVLIDRGGPCGRDVRIISFSM